VPGEQPTLERNESLPKQWTGVKRSIEIVVQHGHSDKVQCFSNTLGFHQQPMQRNSRPVQRLHWLPEGRGRVQHPCVEGSNAGWLRCSDVGPQAERHRRRPGSCACHHRVSLCMLSLSRRIWEIGRMRCGGGVGVGGGCAKESAWHTHAVIMLVRKPKRDLHSPVLAV
jgi:hypothetical protein